MIHPHLTFTPPSFSSPAPSVGRRGEPLIDLHGWPTPAGRAWLARQPLSPPPAPETPERVCARMAAEIARAVSLDGSVTERDLERAGFSPAEIDAHFRAAVEQSGAQEMVP